jgi:hypothetical protein
MSTDIYATMSTDELIQRFAATAKVTGSSWTLVFPRPESKRKALVKEMQAMGAELRSRKPIAKLRRLFEDEDRAVRGWSGAQFGSIDPEWAAATISGLAYKLTVTEVLALRQRVLEGLSPGPALKDLTIDQLIAAFKDACTRLYATTRFLSDEEGGGMDMIAYNHVAGDSYAIAKELAARGKLDALVSLLDDPLITTRQRAATYCLPVATDRALATLEAIKATQTWPEMLFASGTVNEFRNGTYRAVVADGG